MASVVSFLLCVLDVCLSFRNPSRCYNYDQSKLEDKHNVLFVFGDSLFDPGNNQYLNDTDEGTSATSWPYGQTFFHRPTGRLSDGRIVPDFIAQFANLPILPPYLRPGARKLTDGANFASAGAGVLAGTHPGTLHIRMQLQYFKKLKKSLRQQVGGSEAEADKVLKRAVYLFSIGGNDYFSFSTSNLNATESEQKAHVEMVIGNLTLVLEEVYSLGARKIAFQNVGPLGCVPVMKSTQPEVGRSCVEEPSALASLHNRYLSITLKQLESQLTGFRYAIFDYYNLLADRVNNPSKYGFKEGKVACCGRGIYRENGCGGRNGTEPYELCSNPSEYVWFDGAHTTEMANRQLAELLWNGSPTVTAPYNMKNLFQL